MLNQIMTKTNNLVKSKLPDLDSTETYWTRLKAENRINLHIKMHSHLSLSRLKWHLNYANRQLDQVKEEDKPDQTIRYLLEIATIETVLANQSEGN